MKVCPWVSGTDFYNLMHMRKHLYITGLTFASAILPGKLYVQLFVAVMKKIRPRDLDLGA